ncbi:MAG: WD40 repeat domain-containing serine/threonine protein kinase [Verrucomicrobiia bacterium]
MEGSSPTVRLCGQCGAPLPADAPKGVCPSCELQGALGLLDEAEPVQRAGAPDGDSSHVAGRQFGNYELLEEIARGGMGVVYKARQRGLERIVAVKMILVERHAGKQSVQRFRGEAAAAGVLQHPNIVAIHEIGMHEGQHFFSMDYVQGQDLTQLVGHRPLPALQAARYVKQIAEAVHYAHEQGILHRDLKPSNVLIDSATDQPRVTNFGLAKRLTSDSSLTLSGQVLGSPNFLPPEQASQGRGKVGRPSDVFGLGGILYFLLTARAPFQGESLEATIHQVLTTEPVSPRLLNPSVPRDLETICLKCLEKEPARRYATAQEMADELGRFLDDKPILARPVSRSEKAWRWCRRNPAIATLALAAAVIFLLGFGGVAWQWHRASHAAAETRVQRDLAQGHLYAAQMKLAHAACQEGKLGRAMELLRAQQPRPGQSDFRGFDWRFLYRLCLSSSAVLATHSNGFNSVDFSPDGRTVACGRGDGVVELFEVETWRAVPPWTAHDGIVASLAFGGRNPPWLATVSSDDGLLKLWDVASRSVLFATNSLRGYPGFVKLGFSPGGRFLAASTSAHTPQGLSLNLWEVVPLPQGGRPTVRLKANLPFWGPVAFLPGERVMAVCNQPPWAFTVNLYDLTTGATTNLGPAHSDGIICIAASPDGRRLATGSSDERVVVWDLERGSIERVFQGNLIGTSSLAFSPDSQTLFAGCSDQNIHVWQLGDPARSRVLAGHRGAVGPLAISPDGRWLASTGGDGTARLWSLGGTITTLDAAPAHAFTTLLRPDDTREDATAPPGVWALAVSPDELQAAAAVSNRLALFDLPTGRILTSTVASNVFAAGRSEFRSVTFSPDGRRLAVGDDMGLVAFLDATHLQPLMTLTNLHAAMVPDIAYALGGAVLVTSAGFGMGVMLTDVASGRLLTNFHAVEEGFYPLNPLAVSPDGKRVAMGSPDRAIRIRDVASGRVLATCPHKTRFPGCMAFSPDGRWLAVADTDGTFYLWDPSGQQPIRRRSGQAVGVTALAFAPDGTVASGATDHTIRLWHPDIDQEVAILTGHSGWVVHLAFAEHGHALVSSSMDGTMRIWRALSFEQVAAQERAGVVSRPK